MRTRRLLFIIAALLGVAGPAAAAPTLPAQRQRAARVDAQVSAINARLDQVVQAWDGARVQLDAVAGALRQNEIHLRVARSNFRVAQRLLAARLAQLYIDPAPDTVAVIVGALSLSELIDKVEALHSLSAQSASLAQETGLLQREVSRREVELQAEKRARATALGRIAARRQTIASDLARERRLLATIHESVRSLEAQQAAHERAVAALAQQRIARQVEAAKLAAAAEAVAPSQNPVLADPSAPQPQDSTTPSTSPPPVAAPAPPPAAYADAATIAARYLGVPYVWGGASPAGFDCSGLVTYVYAQLGVSLPHYTVSQWDATLPISTSDLQPGDLVFFDGLGHVGIYIGGGQFIHAPHPGTVVQIGDLSGYWSAHLDGARRVP